MARPYVKAQITCDELFPRSQGVAERVGRVNAENLQRTRLAEKREFFERKLETGVVRMAFDVGIELGRRECALQHVAFELGHIDAVGGKAAERLVERRRDVAHL